MTGFAIFIYFFSSFTSNKKTWTHLRLKFLQFLSTFSSNLQKQFSNLLSSTISCERRCNIIPRKKFLASIRQLSVDMFQRNSRRIQYYSTNVQFLCHNGRHSSIFQEAWNIYIYIRNYNYVKAWAERDLGGGMHRLADVSVRSRPLDRIARGNSDVLVTGRRWPSLSDGRRGGTRPGTKSVGTRSYRIEVTAPRQ